MANTISFMHCADIHFDTAFSGLSSAKAALRREELRQTFLRILNICQEKNVDFLLLSGDLFDSTLVTAETISFIQQALASCSNLPVFIAPGNHDPYMPGTRYDSTSWPSNVTIFKQQEIQKYTLTTKAGANVNVFGAAFTTPYLEKNLLESFSVAAQDQNSFNVMALHGDIVSAGQASVYHPITVQSIANSRLDYLALGHKHGATTPERQGQTYFSYSGTPEGRGFDELGDKGIWHVTLTKDTGNTEATLQADWISCCSRKYENIAVDVTGCASHHEILQHIENTASNCENLYKITLTGVLKDGFLPDLNLLQTKLAHYFLVKLQDTTHTDVDLATIAQENMLRGIFARRLLAKIEDARRKGNTKEEQLYTDALTLGLKAFEGEVSVYDYQVNQN